MNEVHLPTVDVKYLASMEFGSGGGRRPEFVRFISRMQRRRLKVEFFVVFF
jgi:hypothetical protein